MRDYEPPYLRKKIRDRLEKEGKIRGFETKWRKPDKSIILSGRTPGQSVHPTGHPSIMKER
jgi:hypothetical protein